MKWGIRQIVGHTSLRPTDVVYIEKMHIPAATGGGGRGKRQLWAPKGVVEFCIAALLMQHGISVKKVGECLDKLRLHKSWQVEIFDVGGSLTEQSKEFLSEYGSHRFIYLVNTAEVIVSPWKTKEEYKIPGPFRTALILDITEDLAMVMEG